MSAVRVLYNAVYDELENEPIIKTVLDFCNQHEYPEKFKAFNYPACLVEMKSVSWDKNMNKMMPFNKEPRTGKATIKVYVLYKTLQEHERDAKNILFSYVDIVTARLQKLQCGDTNVGTFSTLMSVNEEYLLPYSISAGQVRVAVITFDTMLTDMILENEETVEETVSITINTNI